MSGAAVVAHGVTRWAAWSDRATRSAAVLAAFVLPFSTAGANAAFALFVLLWVASPNLADRARRAWQDPVGRAALALFALFVAGVAWSSASAADAWDLVLKYRKLVLLAMLLAVMGERRWQRAVLVAFGAGGAVVFVAALLIHFGMLPQAERGGPGNAVAFKNHITESWVSALLFFFALTGARWARKPALRALMAAGAVAAATHVLWLLIGRTGYLLLVALLVTWAAPLAGWRRALPAALVGVALLGVVALSSDTFVQRVRFTFAEVEQYRETGAVTSWGARYEFARAAARIWLASPIWGHGSGSVPVEHARLPRPHTAAGELTTSNLHGEFSELAVQLGLLGVGAFVWLLVAHGRRARELEPAWRDLAIGLLVAMAVGSTFNSLLRDFTEGHAYALLAGTLLARRQDRA
ncbi:MAG: O-antigen ligase family protein [Pseudomonadota bacterium]